MKTFTKIQVIKLHEQLIKEMGGEVGVRDENLLDSALNAPFQSFGNVNLFPSLQAKAARLCFGLIKNHPFIDGNKRIGTHIMLLFLYFNGIKLKYSQDELSNFILKVASGEKDNNDLLDWIIEHEMF